MLFKLPSLKEAKEVGLKAIKISNLSNIGWKEKDLENLLANNITQLIREDSLMTINQERPMQEEPDILALDKEGTLYIFELKRTRSDEINLLQVLRYGQKYGIYDYDRLNKRYQKYQNTKKSLQIAHKEYFDLEKILDNSSFNSEQKFVIVTAGVDFNTIRAIKYWKKKGLPVDALIYKIYEIGNKLIIDFDPYGPTEEFEIAETSNHIVNTNYSNRKEVYKQMLDEQKASAYGSRKTVIDSIQRGDRVFLYHTGKGICAVGRAISDVETKDFEGVEGNEHYIKCKFDKLINPENNPERALSAREINEKLNLNWSFRPTRFSTDDETADKIEKLFKEKQEKFKSKK